MIVGSRSRPGFAPLMSAHGAVARYAMAALIAFVVAGTAGRAAAQGAAPNTAHPPSQASIALAKQILEIKHAEVVKAVHAQEIVFHSDRAVAKCLVKLFARRVSDQRDLCAIV